MAVTGHESTDDLKILFARKLYTAVVLNASVLKIKDVLKIPYIEKIVNLLKKRSRWNGVRVFLQQYPCFFLVMEENGTTLLKPIVTIEFCRYFDGKKGCSNTYCSKLHVCRHFVKGKCTFGPRCKKPHHFQNKETREVLKKHFLDELSDEQAREFLCRNVQHLLDPESANAELPKSLEICKYYNVATGCTREFCPFIHVCRFYAEEGNCKFGTQCIRKHDINNVHSRILLHRYHMDHLNDQQVLAYLKIKGESRDQQQQQQQQGSNKVDKNSSQVSPPTLLHSFSLPNALLGNIHALVNDGISRKLSQPTPPMMRLPLMDDGLHTRKLSLPTPPTPRASIYRPPVTHEEGTLTSHVNTLTSRVNTPSPNDIKVSSQNADSHHMHSTRHVNNFQSYSLNKEDRFLTRSNILKPIPSIETMKHSFHSENSLSNGNSRHIEKVVSQSLNESSMHFMGNDLHNKLNLNDRPLNCFQHSFNHEGLGLHNLSPPQTTQNTQLMDNEFFSNILSSRSKSYENFQSHSVDRNNIRNGMSKSYQPSYLPYSNSLQSQSNSFFTNRVPFLRTSSNDIISPTDSTSSVNNSNGGYSHALEGNEWTETDKVITRSYPSKDDGEFDLTYYRTRSLPNFLKQENDDDVNIDVKITRQSVCTCQKNRVCVYFLSDTCRYRTCKKNHTEETFQWQISSTPANKSYNGFKNENLDNKITKQRWINVEKNENLKLEAFYCSPDIDDQEIEFYGESMIINFNEMIGTARSDMNSANQMMSSRSCDLSAWLLQANDDVPSRRNSQDVTVYKIRRLSTDSSVTENIDVTFATQWLWFWQDSFGIWRSFPTNKADIIDTNSACCTDDLEQQFLQGYEQFIFEEPNVLVDFKNMLQINCQSRKQKKIRRRPRFITKEQREKVAIVNESMLQFSDVRRPWYWNQEYTSNTYELVEVELNSDTFSTVRNHFMRSMADKDYEILNIKSVQNLSLWSKFISLRTNITTSDIKHTEKFVFKAVAKEELSGVCQQGFQICTCKSIGHTPTENLFATEAVQALSKPTEVNGIAKTVNYVFCVRMTLPDSDIPASEQTSDTSVQNGFTTPDSLVSCRHSYQVYPEFLIIFNL